MSRLGAETTGYPRLIVLDGGTIPNNSEETGYDVAFAKLLWLLV